MKIIRLKLKKSEVCIGFEGCFERKINNQTHTLFGVIIDNDFNKNQFLLLDEEILLDVEITDACIDNMQRTTFKESSIKNIRDFIKTKNVN